MRRSTLAAGQERIDRTGLRRFPASVRHGGHTEETVFWRHRGPVARDRRPSRGNLANAAATASPASATGERDGAPQWDPDVLRVVRQWAAGAADPRRSWPRRYLGLPGSCLE